MTSSVISFACLTHFSNFIISGTNAGICNRKRYFHFFIEFFMIHREYQKVKNLIIVALIPKKLWPFFLQHKVCFSHLWFNKDRDVRMFNT